MRQLLLLATLMIVAFEAAADSPRAIVLRNECDKVDANMGFKCVVRDRSPGLEMRWTTGTAAMPEARRNEVMGEFHRIVMRYYDLGGRQFVISSEQWPQTKVSGCKITPARKYRCGRYECNADRSNCEAIYAPH